LKWLYCMNFSSAFKVAHPWYKVKCTLVSSFFITEIGISFICAWINNKWASQICKQNTELSFVLELNSILPRLAWLKCGFNYIFVASYSWKMEIQQWYVSSSMVIYWQEDCRCMCLVILVAAYVSSENLRVSESLDKWNISYTYLSPIATQTDHNCSWMCSSLYTILSPQRMPEWSCSIQHNHLKEKHSLVHGAILLLPNVSWCETDLFN